MGESDTFDLLVIGGGINGTGIARDAAGRGLSVLLTERGDLACGTSSASSKLVHGGLRYLEHGQFRLVRESLAERELLLRAAPHLVRPLRFVLPHDREHRPGWLIRLGLALYDHLGGTGSLPGSRAVRLAGSPLGAGLRPELVRGFTYWDGWVPDARLVVANAIDAAERGAVILTRTPCLAAGREGALWRVELAGRTVQARRLVNAAGPWAGRVLGAVLGRPGGERLRLVKGSHIVVPRLHDGDHALIVQNADRRVVFALPYEESFTLIGTTDLPFSGDPADADVSDAEIAYLCTAVNRVLARPITPAAVTDRFAGVRPLYDDGRADPSRVSRDYVLALEGGEGEAPLLTVFGGKLTTYRRLAERAVDRLLPGSRCWTAGAVLPGGEGAPALPDWLAPALARRLARSYGSRAGAVLGEARGLADLGRDFGGGLSEREVTWLIEREFARSAADILWRRSKLGLVLTGAQRAELARWLNERDKA